MGGLRPGPGATLCEFPIAPPMPLRERPILSPFDGAESPVTDY
jgi:hypothetical protein